MLNFSRLFGSEDWVKSIAKNILEYIYQTDIDYDERYVIDLVWVDRTVYHWDPPTSYIDDSDTSAGAS